MSTAAGDRAKGGMGMYATIVDVIDAGGFWLLQAEFRRGIAETPVEHRFMDDIVTGEGLSSPTELIGRRIWVSKDGTQIAFVDPDPPSSDAPTPAVLLTDEDKRLLPPLGSTDGLPAEDRRVPIVLEGANGWVWYLLEGGEVDYGYECFAIVDGADCEAGAVALEVVPEHGEEEGLAYHARRGLVWKRAGHDPNTTLAQLKEGELRGKVHF